MTPDATSSQSAPGNDPTGKKGRSQQAQRVRWGAFRPFQTQGHMNEIILRNDSQLGVSIAPHAEALKEQALLNSAWIVSVSDAPIQKKAVAAQASIHELLSLVEKDRKAVKEPVLDYGRAIDKAAKDFRTDLEAEQLRLGKLLGDFHQLELARIAAEQQAQNQRLADIERERAKELARVTSIEQIDAVREKYQQMVEMEGAPLAVAKAEGQRVTEDWEVTVNDVWALARAHPACVKIEPRMSEIKGLLKAGVKVAGVQAKRIVKSTVRTPNDR